MTEKIVSSILDLIGITPIVPLNKVAPKQAAEVYVKLEYFNAGGSVKDRMAKILVESAEKAGELKKETSLSKQQVETLE